MLLDPEPFGSLMNGLGPAHVFSVKQACKIDSVRILTHTPLSNLLLSSSPYLSAISLVTGTFSVLHGSNSTFQTEHA